MPIPAGAELVPRIVAVHEVDPAGNGLDPVDQAGQLLARSERVAGIQAEANFAAALGRVGYRVPQSGDRVQALGHRTITAGCVLDQHRQRPVDPLDGLPPAVVALLRVSARCDVPAMNDEALRADRGSGSELLLEQLPAGNPDPVIGRRHVDDVRRMDVAGDVGGLESGPQLGGVGGEGGRLPALWVAEKVLHGAGTERRCLC